MDFLIKTDFFDLSASFPYSTLLSLFLSLTDAAFAGVRHRCSPSLYFALQSVSSDHALFLYAYVVFSDPLALLSVLPLRGLSPKILGFIILTLAFHEDLGRLFSLLKSIFSSGFNSNRDKVINYVSIH